MREVAAVGQDPAFGDGSWAQQRSFLDATRSLGLAPTLHYPSMRRALRTAGTDLGRRYRNPLPEANAVGIVASAREISRAVRAVDTLWVVSAVAPYGEGARRSSRPYACWVASDLESEWESRLPRLDRARRLALRANRPVLRRLERAVLRGARRVYSISPASAARLAASAGLRVDAVRVLPIPVDTAEFAPAREPPARPTVVFVGRADDPRKNVALLVDAFARVRARDPDARLRLVGTPPASPVPPWVEVAGRVESVAGELRQASLLVLPSLQEGFGLVVAEALAAGVPAIVTPCGGPEELVRASGGGRVLAGFDPEELAEAIACGLADPAALAEQGRRGREYVAREHAPERLRSLLDDAFQELDGC